MDDVKGRRAEGQVILWAVRWHGKHGVSTRELAEMLEERGVVVDHATTWRWTQRYAPEVETPPRSRGACGGAGAGRA